MCGNFNNEKMKRKYVIIVVFLFAACETSKLQQFNNSKDENAFINAFKDHVFFKCFYASYPYNVRDSISRIMMKYELYNPNEDFRIYAFENKKLIDSLGISIPKNIPPFWHIEGEENKGKNVYLATCLHYYASSQLDSIARTEYKKYRKAEKKAGFR